MKILFIGPHPDDIEIGCAGTVARFVKEGKEVWFHILGRCRDDGVSELSCNLLEEAKRSAQALGVSKIHFDDFKRRRYPEQSYEIRTSLETTERLLKPDTVFLPTEYDLHQDHITCSIEAQRAFRGKEELCAYETISARIGFKPNLFINIEDQITLKDAALKLYVTQEKRPYFVNKDWLNMASYWSHKSNYSLRTPVEAFEILRKFI